MFCGWVLNHIWTKGEVGAPSTPLKPSSKIFYWPFQGGSSFVDILCFCVMCLLCLCTRLFICALWSPTEKRLTSWLSFAASYCDFVTFPFVSWVRCGTWLYRFLIFAPLLLKKCLVCSLQPCGHLLESAYLLALSLSIWWLGSGVILDFYWFPIFAYFHLMIRKYRVL